MRKVALTLLLAAGCHDFESLSRGSDGPPRDLSASSDGGAAIDLATGDDDAGLCAPPPAPDLGRADARPVTLSFAPEVKLGGPVDQSSLVATDLNRDGFPDVVATSFSTSAFAVWMNDGIGHLAPPTSTPIGAMGAADLAVGDLNGDGVADLVVSARGTDQVQLFRGNGTGAFQLQVGLPVANSPDAVVLAHFDCDGILDLAVTQVDGLGIQVFKGLGDGTFMTPGTHYPTDDAPQAIVAADFNRDGLVDLAVGNLVGNTVTVLLGKGNGAFNAGQETPSSNPRALVATDYDRDGKLDLIASDASGPFVHVLKGAGDGTFAPSANPQAGAPNRALVAADFDRDGFPDVALTRPSPTGDVTLLLGSANGFTLIPSPGFSMGNFWSIAVADIDGDTRPDLIAGTADVGLRVMLNKSQ